MSGLVGNPFLLASAAGAGGYEISRSLRFNSSDSGYCSKTYSTSPTSGTTQTVALWAKRSALGTLQELFWGYNGSSPEATGIGFLATSDCLRFSFGGASPYYYLITTQVFRDVSAWYHITLSIDTTQATASNRVKIYVNGSQITSFSTADYPQQNATSQFALANSNNKIGTTWNHSANFFNGYLADIHFIDGQALDPTSFGEFSATTGVWMPKAYTGTYGTNGFHLDFSNNASAAALGTDSSGRGNTWTVNNLSVTAGAGNDSLVDVPTNGSEVDTGSGGQVRGNYATFNPLATAGTLSNGNLQLAISGSQETSGLNTIAFPSSGKWYWEVTMDTIGADPYTGITDGASRTSLGNAYVAYKGNNGGFTSYPTATNPPSAAAYTSGDTIGLAFDVDSRTLAFYKNGTLQGTTTNIPVNQYFTLCYDYQTAQKTINFGQRPFARSGGAPSGFKALCTANLPAPVVTKPSTVMDVKLYTGNSSTQAISGLGFSPDLVWIKERSNASSHCIFDVVRGTSSVLSSNSTNLQDTTNALSSFDSTGFTLLYPNTGDYYVNRSSQPYVAWAWDAGSSTVTNTQGSITSQVRANASAGFSVVSWSANNAANQSIGHGLGVTPAFIIHKNRITAGNWNCWFTGFSNDEYINLNGTGAKATTGGGLWYQTPTSSVFYIGFTGSAINNSTNAIISYCFAPVAGYSSFGSYTGNGSTDGPFVYTNLRPAFVLIKATGAVGGNWMIYDNRRAPSNLNNKKLAANAALQENEAANLGDDSLGIDFLSNGFKIRQTGANHNDNGVQYIYAAFAESPFQYARAR